jgi:hypothetical protein
MRLRSLSDVASTSCAATPTALVCHRGGDVVVVIVVVVTGVARFTSAFSPFSRAVDSRARTRVTALGD